jgi:hypothetical protein
MSISSISGNYPAITSTQFSTTAPVSYAQPDSDCDTDGVSASRPARGGGKFASAIDQALSQLGVSASGTAGASSAGAAQGPQQALVTFKQNLFAALQAQSGQPDNAAVEAASGSAAGASPAVHGHHQHGGGKLEAGLQSLIQQLSSSNAGTADSSAASGSSSPAQDSLQQSFKNLMAADGASGSSATLSSFLQTLSQNMHSAPPTGNIVSTSA